MPRFGPRGVTFCFCYSPCSMHGVLLLRQAHVHFEVLRSRQPGITQKRLRVQQQCREQGTTDGTKGLKCGPTDGDLILCPLMKGLRLQRAVLLYAQQYCCTCGIHITCRLLTVRPPPKQTCANLALSANMLDYCIRFAHSCCLGWFFVCRDLRQACERLDSGAWQW